MKNTTTKLLLTIVAMLIMSSLIISGCSPQTATEKPAAEAEVAQATAPSSSEASATEMPSPVVNRAGVELPADAAPLEEQVFRKPSGNDDAPWLTWDASAYDINTGTDYGWSDSCTRPDKDFNPQPSGCESWSLSEDGLTWTFTLPKDKVWSDGEPVTAKDWVFILTRYARPDYDFEWFYSSTNIVNWSELVDGAVGVEEFGAKVVDDYTFTVTTSVPTPYIPKLFSDLWVYPEHIIKDRLADGSWALNPDNWVSCGPYKLEAWNKGEEMIFVANDTYTGPYPPLFDKIISYVMPAEAVYNAYKNDEVDITSGGYSTDLTPSNLAEIMADPDLKSQYFSWPNFITFYLFFDTWNAPFNDLKVRQAFSHAIDRDFLVEGPVKFQASPAFSMNPPGFPGENVEELKSIQNYDPELAAQLLAEAGFPGGEGFPPLVVHLRDARPGEQAAAEAVAAMITDNLGIKTEVQNLDSAMFNQKMRDQKKNKEGDFLFGIVPYEFDFVDGSNLLGVWGGCNRETDNMSEQPGRHAWYSEDFNNLICEADSFMGDDAERNKIYQQAERILIEDVAMVPLYHGVLSVMIKPDIVGPMFEPNAVGLVRIDRFRFSGFETQIYRSEGTR